MFLIVGLLLMKKKSNKMYKKVFDTIKEVTGIDILNKECTVLGDFEICGQIFFSKGFEKCCFFHYTQIIWRKCQKLSKSEYEKKGDFYLCARLLMVLPLIKKQYRKSDGIYQNNIYRKIGETIDQLF